jgi:hypothetical protein
VAGDKSPLQAAGSVLTAGVCVGAGGLGEGAFEILSGEAFTSLVFVLPENSMVGFVVGAEAALYVPTPIPITIIGSTSKPR